MQTMLPAFLRRLVPDLAPVNLADRLRAALGALIGLAVTGAATRVALGEAANLPLLIAPMGASSVLLFAVPSSPLAQPWSLIGGNLVAALAGVAAARLVPDPILASALACAVAIGLMLTLRCLHPPSGAVALTAVLGGEAVRAAGFFFVLAPVLLNSALLLATALAFHALTGRRYPNLAGPKPATPPRTAATAPARFSSEDLDRALAAHGQLLDVSRADLQTVLRLAEVNAYARRAGTLTCADIMTRDVRAVAPDAPIGLAFALLRGQRAKALPVTDEAAHVVGIVTQTDLLDKAAWGPRGPRVSFVQRLRHVVRLARAPQGSVQEIMSTPVRAVRAETPIAELVPLMADAGLSALPVVDIHDKLAGMVVQADLIAGLFLDRLDGRRDGVPPG